MILEQHWKIFQIGLLQVWLKVWFATRLIKKRFVTLYADENMLYFNEDSGNVVMEWVFLI